MSSPVFLHDLDEPQRRAALDPTQSFTVRAPAGSGKTELLIQRFLRLLAIVKKPEAIVAITFTRKASGEMLDRILNALRDAKGGTPVNQPHLEITRGLAQQVLQRDQELGWDILEHPGRLRVQTIDSLCMTITGEMPWLARLGGMPRIEEDARRLYEEAAHQTLLESDPEYQQALTTLLRHLDNNSTHARELIATMLANRDQWLKLLTLDDEGARGALEKALADTVTKCLSAVDQLVAPEFRGIWMELARYAVSPLRDLRVWPAAAIENTWVWSGLADLLLTVSGTWRKRGGLNVTCGFPKGSDPQKNQCVGLIANLQSCNGLLETLCRLRELPPPSYSDYQWDVLRALLQTLRLAVAQLKMVFQSQRVIDFMELGIAAREALGRIDNPTEVAYRMDSRIEHLLVDEFQDTSRAQFELLEKLTGGWEAGDGRTLFLVGDPMQSIYRFRQAEVGLFHEVEKNGIGGLPMAGLELKLNRRSRPAIVERVNTLFSDSFPKIADDDSGAVKYTPSIAAAAREEPAGIVTIDGFVEGEDQLEAARVIERIRAAQREDPEGSISILVRARSHLFAIIEALKAVALPFSAVDIDPLAGRSIVRDLLALTGAMLDPADRIAWLSILRAPWCGLTLVDLEALVRDRTTTGIWDCLKDLGPLSADGRQRAARVREVLAEAFAEQGRWPLRRWVERAWMRLGGPACLEGSEGALQDAAAYFNLLEAEQSGADVRDFDRFRKRVTELFAQPENPLGAVLHVLTIHKAKGLEFDTVIVPGLGRHAKREDKPLVLFHEWRVENGFECLVAPIDETRAEPDELYHYLRRLDRRKDGRERTRQLYVAATRAKKRLHLLGHVGSKGEPAAGSMLADLWPAFSLEERARFQRAAAGLPPPTPPRPEGVLRRLPESWQLPELPAPVAWQGTAPRYAEPHEPTFEWVGESLRHTGTVVHAFVQGMKSADEPGPDGPAIRRALMHAGVSPLELEAAAQRVRQALARIRTSRRGRWILEPHDDLHSEYAVTGVLNGEVVRGLVDRTFVDSGVRWIIDFKTSEHQGGKLAEFLDEQQRRYSDQMERYARILAPLGNPVRLGLYFPLLDEWREWAPEQTADAAAPVWRQAKLFSS
ncbi:MAG: UvrD-helicase domain-containing protein [Acidobacteriota bacterium]